MAALEVVPHFFFASLVIFFVFYFFFLLSMTLYDTEYPFVQIKSAVPAVPPPSFFSNPQTPYLRVGTEKCCASTV